MANKEILVCCRVTSSQAYKFILFVPKVRCPDSRESYLRVPTKADIETILDCNPVQDPPPLWLHLYFRGIKPPQ